MSINETVDAGAILVTGPTDSAPDRRRSRHKLLLAATIQSAGIDSPVRIRDLSETGALLEGPVFPPAGTVLTLMRLAMKMDARVVWHKPPRCGVEFRDRVSISEWISGKPGPANFGQVRVDAIQAAVRAGTPAPSDASVDSAAVDLDSVEDRIVAELNDLRRLLETMGSELSSDPEFVLRHAAVLQDFDLAGQILGHLGTIISADDRLTAIGRIGMAELRARLLQDRSATRG